MLTALVHFPHWEAHSLVIDTPPGAPAAVAENGQVGDHTPAAAHHGIRRGMRLALARYLCPNLIVMPTDPQRSARSFHQVLTALDQVGTQVHALTPGTAWMPADPLIKWHGEASAAAETIINTISEYTGSDCQVGIGPGLLGAWVSLKAETLLADDPADERIANFPLADLTHLYPPAAHTLEQTTAELKDLGIVTIVQARTLGVETLRSRYPQAAGFFTTLLDSKQTPTSVEITAPKTLRREITFPSAVADIDHVVGQLKQVSQSLVRACMAQQVSARYLQISAHIQTPTGTITRQRSWALLEVITTRDLLDRIRWQLQGWVSEIQTGPQVAADFTDLPTGVSAVRLQARELVPLADISPHLWDQDTDTRARAHAGAYRLQALLGEDQVTCINVDPGYDPRSRVQQYQWGTPAPQAAWKTHKPGSKTSHLPTYRPEQRWKGGVELPAPSTVLDHPLPVEVTGEGGRSVEVKPDGSLTDAPRRLRLPDPDDAALGVGPLADALYPPPQRGERYHQIAGVAGPWPVMGPWWREKTSGKVWLQVQVENVPPILLAWEKPRWLLHAVWF